LATPADLSSAAEAYATQQQITAAAVAAARRVRPQTPETIAATLAAYQLLAAQQGAAAVPATLAEQGISAQAVANVVASSLAGFSSAGYPLATMFETLQNAGQLAMLVATTVQDAGRNGASLQMAVTPSVTGYVRMLNPPSCSRCTILAGKVFKWNQGFDRHPNCDCRHIPVDENTAGDLTTDPEAYFDSLPTSEQDRIFTKAGAQAIRDGANIGQVVNARKGMHTAQINPRGWIPKGRLASQEVFGQQVFTTTAGTTRRGSARKAMGSGRPVRLMPESIYALATDRTDALRLLKLYGFIR
jgi:hypothetical protein